MNTSTGSSIPNWRSAQSASTALPIGPAWAAPPPPRTYRSRWWKLLLVAGLGLVVLATVVWVALWMRPPEPARLIVLCATNDVNLCVPANPYGKAAAAELAKLTDPNGWFGRRSRLNGTPQVAPLRRGMLLPDLEGVREKCVVVAIAAHGGRDHGGAFLFPEGAGTEPDTRVRVKALIERLATLPANKQKILILDATQLPAYTDLGLIHNDFASALLELEPAIAAVPNLIVFSSSGLDQRSWTSPEWGSSSFAHFVNTGLNGAADRNHDQRISAAELIEFVRSQVTAWARDHRSARQIPMLLPQGREGEKRAQTMHLVMTDGRVPALAAPVPFDPPQDVEQLWNEYRLLAADTPPPQAYTPLAWREYEAWVLRFEQLTLAGDHMGASQVRVRASEAKQRIEAARRLHVSTQTLALPAGVGGWPFIAEPPAEFVAAIDRVADPTLATAQRVTEWSKVRTIAASYDSAQARILWARALLKWVADDPPARLSVVPEVLPIVVGDFALRPAEIHFLIMLARHAVPSDHSARVVTILRTVLTLREEAETAALSLPMKGYPYSEFCLAWVKEEIAQGDTERRQAEDLAFATDEASWARAEVHAASAHAHYLKAREHAAIVRTLVHAWHSAADGTPGIGEWLARAVRNSADENNLTREMAYRETLSIWTKIHAAGSLAAMTPETSSLAELDAMGQALAAQYAKLDSELETETRALLTVHPEFEGKITPRHEAIHWLHRCEAVLTAPPAHAITPASRRVLLREYGRVSRQLHITGLTQPQSLPEISAALTHEHAFDMARRRGQFLLAQVGESYYTALTAGKLGRSFQHLTFQLQDFASRAEARKSLLEVEDQLSEVFALLARTPANTREADRRIRLVRVNALPEVHVNPARELRKAGAHELLVHQARRTLLDHWYAENNSRYYQRAIVQLRADADQIRGIALGTIPPGSANEIDPFAALVAADEEAFPVEPVLPKHFVMTDEPQAEFTLSFTRHLDRSGRPGFPVFWSDEPFTRSPGISAERTPMSTQADTPLTPYHRSVRAPDLKPKPTSPAAIPGEIHISGFYRGRTIHRTISARAFPVPDHTAVTFPSDTNTAVAVRADPALLAKYGSGNGTVVILLDCSGSMRPPQAPKSPPPYPDETPATFAREGLFDDAAQALEELLSGLPPGTVVAVRTFSRRSSNAKTAEESIQTLLPPTKLEFDRAPLVKRVMDEVNSISIGDLWYESPVLHAVTDAKDWLRAHPEYPGPFKSVVLISDETDNRYAQDPKFAKPKRELKEILKAEFNGSNVSLGVVALKVNTDADRKMQADFKVIESFNPAGKMVPLKDTAKLVQWLHTGLLPRIRYTLIAPDGGATELTATASDPDNWFTRSRLTGDFTIHIHGDLDLTQNLFLNRGDRLWLELTENAGRLQLTRRWFARSWPSTIAQVGNADWRLACLQNWEKDGQLRIVAGIDERPRPQRVIDEPTIAEAWFDLGPDRARTAPLAVRWRPVPGFPGSCWSVTIPGGWPAGGKAAPILEARWSGAARFSSFHTWVPQVGSEIISKRAVSLTDDNSVTLDSVVFEEHTVEVAPDRFEKRLCFTTRISSMPGNPIWVRPTGFSFAGSEIRFYQGANRTTCLFWWNDKSLTPDRVKAAIRGFEVISLRQSQGDADAAGRRLKLDTLPPATDQSLPPTPPLSAPGRN